MSVRVEFRLAMPSRGNAVSSSWGEGRNYVRVRHVTDEQARQLFGVGTKASWYHRWDDGWGAEVRGRIMDRGERTPKSDGFAGYDWMIDNIIRYGSPYTTGTADGQSPEAPNAR